LEAEHVHSSDGRKGEMKKRLQTKPPGPLTKKIEQRRVRRVRRGAWFGLEVGAVRGAGGRRRAGGERSAVAAALGAREEME
jgi:hypothetical protein